MKEGVIDIFSSGHTVYCSIIIGGKHNNIRNMLILSCYMSDTKFGPGDFLRENPLCSWVAFLFTRSTDMDIRFSWRTNMMYYVQMFFEVVFILKRMS